MYLFLWKSLLIDSLLGISDSLVIYQGRYLGWGKSYINLTCYQLCLLCALILIWTIIKSDVELLTQERAGMLPNLQYFFFPVQHVCLISSVLGEPLSSLRLIEDGPTSCCLLPVKLLVHKQRAHREILNVPQVSASEADHWRETF